MITVGDLTLVRIALNNARRHDLEPEVVAFAIKYASKHSKADIGECIQAGIEEWVKKMIPIKSKLNFTIGNSCYCYNEECNQKEWERQGFTGPCKWVVVSTFKLRGRGIRTPKCPYCKKSMIVTANLSYGS